MEDLYRDEGLVSICEKFISAKGIESIGNHSLATKIIESTGLLEDVDLLLACEVIYANYSKIQEKKRSKK
jgi:hypothetical protein